MPFTYQYDPFGTYPANQIVNEIHTVVAATGDDDANFIVPNAAPFFMNGLTVKTGPAPTDPVLVENVDYYLTHQFVEATQSLNKRIFGSITFVNRLYTGTVYLTYQTLGGPYTLNDYNVVRTLTRSLYAIRVVTWGQIVGVPVAFPPVEHPHHTSDLTGMTDIVAALELIRQTIGSNSGNLNTLVATLTQHLTGLASHTKAQVGLNFVENYPPATQTDIENITPGRYVTVTELIYAIARYNTTGVHMTDATDLAKGISRLANAMEAVNRTSPSNTVVITPATLRLALEIPIGDYWFTGDAAKDPATYWGYGTWVRVHGFPVGYDENNPKFSTAGQTGGAEGVQLNSDNLPTSMKLTAKGRTGSGGSVTNTPGFSLATSDQGDVEVTVAVDSNNTAVDILPPYFVLCIWKRTA